MKKRNKKTHKAFTRKLDPRLLALTGYRLEDLDKMKRRDTKDYLTYLRELTAWREKYPPTDYKQKGKKKGKQPKKEQTPPQPFVPFTFGLYFPEHASKEVATFTKHKNPFISCMIKSEARAADLRKLGIEVRTQAGSVFTANVQFSHIDELVESPLIDYIELGRPNFENLGQGIPYAQLDTLHAASPSATGNGVIVGIVDSHPDIYHVDFRNNDGAGGDSLGSSRILFFWHQWLTANASESGPPVAPTLPGFTPAGGTTYGVEYNQATINAELNNFAPATAPTPQAAYQTVRHGYSSVNSLAGAHGTHVMGCAAGNGRSGNVGAAPNADIIYVQLGGTTNYIVADQTTMADAFSYVFARASQLGQPCVVNRSGSDNMGPHDGTTLGEQFLDNLLLTPGRAITLAAGNTDTFNSHTNGTVTAGGTTNVTVNYTAGAQRNDEIELWYDGHDSFSCVLTGPGGLSIGPITLGNTSALTSMANGVTVQVVHGNNDPRNGDNVITVFIANVSNANNIPAGNWTLQLTGTTVINGNFNAWVDRNNRFQRGWNNPVAGSMTIATPATMLRALATGAHDTTAGSPNTTNFTSAGPTRDGRVKPDISAHGLNVIAANSANKNNTTPPAQTFAQSGTSMAAPIVAGACACLFECRGAALSWFDLKQIIWNTAGTPTVGIPSNKFGFGFLQMANACTTPAEDVDVWLRDDIPDTGVEPYIGGISWRSPDIEVLDLGGTPVANPTHDPASLISNLVRVTVRNRGTQTAFNVQVFLHWADPGTNLPYPGEWQRTGIYTGDPNWVVESNAIVIPQLAAGATTQVTFGWAPPAPGANLRGDDHFCLLARLETEADPSNIGAGGWNVIRGSNNIALRNTNVVELPGDDDSADSAFFVTGTAFMDSLWLDLEDLSANLTLTLPVAALPFRDGRLIQKYGKRPGYGSDCKEDPLAKMKITLKKEEIGELTGITGARSIVIRNGVAEIRKTGKDRLEIPFLHIRDGAKMPVGLRIGKARLKDKIGMVHVAQLTGGHRAGGVTVEVWKKLPKVKRYRALRKGDKLKITKA